MGVRTSSVFAVGPALNNLNPAESIVFQVGPLVVPGDSSSIFLKYWMNLLVGTTGSQLRIKIRRGTTLVSTIVGIATGWETFEVVQLQRSFHNGYFVDTPAAPGPLFYVLTLQVINAIALSTLLDGCLVALVL